MDLELLIENIPGVVYRCHNDPDWTMEFMSGWIKQLSGYDASEFISRKRTYASLIHPDDRDRVWDEIQDAVKQNDTFVVEYRIVNKDNTIRWVWERGKCLLGEGEGVFLEGVITDETKYKKMFEDLKQKNEDLEKLQRLAIAREVKMAELKEKMESSK